MTRTSSRANLFHFFLLDNTSRLTLVLTIELYRCDVDALNLTSAKNISVLNGQDGLLLDDNSIN